jgi:hypothetical protein
MRTPLQHAGGRVFRTITGVGRERLRRASAAQMDQAVAEARRQRSQKHQLSLHDLLVFLYCSELALFKFRRFQFYNENVILFCCIYARDSNLRRP